mmetsp:Transcript_16898/g.21944  ORF Transcript_16898/g.21944 Transcript_16898/m.21944 type:complete len:229 (-) Transcript_16898:385-1071(-)
MITSTLPKFCIFVCLAIVGCVYGSEEPKIETKLNVRKAAVPSVQRSLADINTSNADASFLSALWNLVHPPHPPHHPGGGSSSGGSSGSGGSGSGGSGSGGSGGSSGSGSDGSSSANDGSYYNGGGDSSGTSNAFSSAFQSTTSSIIAFVVAAACVGMIVAAVAVRRSRRNKAKSHPLAGGVGRRIGMFQRIADRVKLGTNKNRPERVVEMPNPKNFSPTPGGDDYVRA